MLKLKLQYFVRLKRGANSLEKTLMMGKTESRRKGAEDEIVGWHYRLDRHGFEQTLGDSKGQRSLVHCSPRSHKSDTT